MVIRIQLTLELFVRETAFERIVFSRAAFILTELHVQYPVETVLDAPMLALCRHKLFGGHVFTAIDEIID